MSPNLPGYYWVQQLGEAPLLVRVLSNGEVHFIDYNSFKLLSELDNSYVWSDRLVPQTVADDEAFSQSIC